MASARDIQRRIRSVGSIGKVTRAMEAVSASKMRRAQAATLASRAYAAKAAEVLAYLRAQPGAGTSIHPLLQDHPVGHPGVVLITPNRGLTGGLVLNVIRFAYQQAHDRFGSEVRWVTIGAKGRDFIARRGEGYVAEYSEIPDGPSLTDLTQITSLLLSGFLGTDFSSVHVVFADFLSVMRQEPTMTLLLPIDVPEEVERMPAEFAYEPSAEAVLDEVLPRLLELRLYQAVLEAQASEHSARMVAMRNATEAASELVDELTLSFNKVRQSDITSELLDIAGGAEALRQSLETAR